MFKFHLDSLITIPSILLLLLGLTILRSIVPDLFTTQLFFIAISLIIFIFASSIDSEVFFSLGSIGYFFFLLLTMSLPLIGFLSRGATRWIQLGSFTLQPSEILKPFLLLALAHVATFHTTRQNLILMLMGIIPILVVFMQPDLGTSLVLFVGWGGFVLTRFRLKSLLALLLILVVSSLPIYQFILKDYQRERITTFINPYADPLGRGYHIIQSMIAVGSGQFFGRGLGHGTQTQLRFLPEHHTDFIFSSISEELGFVGSSITILLYFVLLFRIYRISQETADPKSAFFCLSALGMLGFQIFVNIGMNIGLSPITGITLPLLSYGGSSLLSTSIILAVVNSVSAKIHGQKYWTIH